MAEVVKCIDVSHWQAFPDFKKVAASGVIAMIHKATEGTSYVDPNRANNTINAMEAGISCATYFWLKPGTYGKAQAEFYLKIIQPVQGERVVIDYEESGCDLDDLYGAVEALIDYDKNLQIAVYSGHLLKEQLGGDHDMFLAEHTSLWLAQYTTGTPSWPKGTYPQWSLWQYTDKGHIDGVEGYCDCNRFNGSDEQLLKWIRPVDDIIKPPKPERPEKHQVVTITIEAPPGVEIVVIQEEP